MPKNVAFLGRSDAIPNAVRVFPLKKKTPVASRNHVKLAAPKKKLQLLFLEHDILARCH